MPNPDNESEPTAGDLLIMAANESNRFHKALKAKSNLVATTARFGNSRVVGE